MPGVPPDALAQVKRGLRGLFGRKKRQQQEQQQQQQEAQQQKPTQTTDSTPTITTTAPSPAPAAMGPDSTDGHKTQATKNEINPPAPAPGATPSAPSSSAPPPATPTQAPLPATETSKPADAATTGSTAGDHNIPAPTQISEAKSIDLNPKAPASASAEPTAAPIATQSTDTAGNAGAGAGAASVKETGVDGASSKKMNEGGMSATSGPLSLTDDPMAHGYADEGMVNRSVAAEGV
ncbi:MAG: hypothetical protein Q9205_001171, partial [Flavoplaca limonia]